MVITQIGRKKLGGHHACLGDIYTINRPDGWKERRRMQCVGRNLTAIQLWHLGKSALEGESINIIFSETLYLN